MRILTQNVNGLRAARRKQMDALIAAAQADVLCLQEVRAEADIVAEAAADWGYAHWQLHAAEKKGYSGVALLARQAPEQWQAGIDMDWIDCEGRLLAARFGKLWVISAYFPSGSSGETRQLYKYRFLDAVTPWLEKLSRHHHVVLCGDLNIAHRNDDIRNWRGNKKNSGFLPVERGWLWYLQEELGFVDVFRSRPQEAHRYTWWSQRGQARANNVGWRIDYQWVSSGLAENIGEMEIVAQPGVSDHAAFWVDYGSGDNL